MSSDTTPADTNSWKILLATIFSVTITTSAVVLRIVSRRLSAIECWWDDWTIIASLIVFWALANIQWISVKGLRYGEHVANIDVDQLPLLYKAYVGMQVVYHLNAALTQVSIVLFFQRLFGQQKIFKIVLASTGCVIICFWGCCTICAVLGCKPFGGASQACIDLLPFLRVSAAVNFVINLFIFMLPVPVIWALELTTLQKFEALAITWSGLLVSVASVMRVVAFSNANASDLTYTGVEPMDWSMVEQGGLIVCACLPILRPLFRCCRQPSISESLQSITSFTFRAFDERSPRDLESMNVHAKSTTDTPPNTPSSSRRETTTLVMEPERVHTPEPAHVGVAIAGPPQEDATAIFRDHPICAAILASHPQEEYRHSDPALNRYVDLTPQMAAFRQQTRGLAHSRSNFF